MFKIKYILAVLIIAVFVYACDDNTGFVNPYEGTDYEALALEDKDSIVYFLQNNYYNSDLDSIKLIENGEESLFDSDNLYDEDIEVDGITHTLYTYVVSQGIPDEEAQEERDYEKPSNIDSVLVNYNGTILVNKELNIVFDSGSTLWFGQVITGFAYGLTNFLPGKNTSISGERISFENPGKGYVFIPSGLAYPSSGYVFGDSNTLYDLILVFKVELLDFVSNTDHDNDGTPSIDEDANNDGNPRNDFNDEDFPTTPDYLNPTICNDCDD